jgi:hypothetical protein
MSTAKMRVNEHLLDLLNDEMMLHIMSGSYTSQNKSFLFDKSRRVEVIKWEKESPVAVSKWYFAVTSYVEWFTRLLLVTLFFKTC